MSGKLVVDEHSQLKEIESHEKVKFSVLRVVAKVFSYLFHPVFIPVYIILFLLFMHPSVFSGYSRWQKTTILLQALSMYGLFPIITVLLLKAVGFIQSVFLHTQRDRVIPYIACGIWYFWIWYVWKNLPASPPEIVVLAMAIFLASVAGLMSNIYIKISMHAIAAGVSLMYIIWLGLNEPVASGMYISIAVLVAGLICTSRFLASNHTPKEIYLGMAFGILSVLLSAWVS